METFDGLDGTAPPTHCPLCSDPNSSWVYHNGGPCPALSPPAPELSPIVPMDFNLLRRVSDLETQVEEQKVELGDLQRNFDEVVETADNLRAQLDKLRYPHLTLGDPSERVEVKSREQVTKEARDRDGY